MNPYDLVHGTKTLKRKDYQVRLLRDEDEGESGTHAASSGFHAASSATSIKSTSLREDSETDSDDETKISSSTSNIYKCVGCDDIFDTKRALLDHTIEILLADSTDDHLDLFRPLEQHPHRAALKRVIDSVRRELNHQPRRLHCPACKWSLSLRHKAGGRERSRSRSPDGFGNVASGSKSPPRFQEGARDSLDLLLAHAGKFGDKGDAHVDHKRFLMCLANAILDARRPKFYNPKTKIMGGDWIEADTRVRELVAVMLTTPFDLDVYKEIEAKSLGERDQDMFIRPQKEKRLKFAASKEMKKKEKLKQKKNERKHGELDIWAPSSSSESDGGGANGQEQVRIPANADIFDLEAELPRYGPLQDPQKPEVVDEEDIFSAPVTVEILDSD